MNKRRFNEIPRVEKLYRENQVSYNLAGGFDAEDDIHEEIREKIAESVQKRRDLPFDHLIAPDNCIDCGKPLYDAFLWEKFNHATCDKCRDDTGRHKLIARTEAKNEYLLKDCDLDRRKPPLRFIAKKNPHNPRYGDMKLYLRLQVEQRALELFGSLSNLQDAKDQKVRLREINTEKRFEKKIKQMRKEISGTSQVKLTTSNKHEHEFETEIYNTELDIYSKTCKTCGFYTTFEKM